MLVDVTVHGASSSGLVTMTLLITGTVPGVVGMTTFIVISTDGSATSSRPFGIVHVIVRPTGPPQTTPAGNGANDWNTTSAGSTSTTVASTVASDGPRLFTPIVYVNGKPAPTAGWLTIFVTSRS